MTAIDREWMKRYVEGWAEVNRITAAERARRLRNWTDPECRAAMEDMILFAVPGLPERPSGLVELQRILHTRDE
jgi:hypothetical protein